MGISLLAEHIFSLSSINIFNPYRDVCLSADLPDAPAKRRYNLIQYLGSFSTEDKNDLWLAEAGSYKGLRRTGVPLIPESALQNAHLMLQSTNPLMVVTHPPYQSAYTAKVVWNEAIKLSKMPMLWNAIMGHPHQGHESHSNRNPTKGELALHAKTLEILLATFPIDRIICIGKKAVETARNFDTEGVYVRHPANGGAKLFREGIRSLYSIKK